MSGQREIDFTAARSDQEADALASQAKALVRAAVHDPQANPEELSLPPRDELKALALKVVTNNNER